MADILKENRFAAMTIENRHVGPLSLLIVDFVATVLQFRLTAGIAKRNPTHRHSFCPHFLPETLGNLWKRISLFRWPGAMGFPIKRRNRIMIRFNLAMPLIQSFLVFCIFHASVMVVPMVIASNRPFHCRIPKNGCVLLQDGSRATARPDGPEYAFLTEKAVWVELAICSKAASERAIGQQGRFLMPHRTKTNPHLFLVRMPMENERIKCNAIQHWCCCDEPWTSKLAIGVQSLNR
jgi:hypothetical protein